MEHCSAIYMNDLLTCATAWMNLRVILLSERKKYMGRAVWRVDLTVRCGYKGSYCGAGVEDSLEIITSLLLPETSRMRSPPFSRIWGNWNTRLGTYVVHNASLYLYVYSMSRRPLHGGVLCSEHI